MRAVRSEGWFRLAFVLHTGIVITVASLAYSGHLHLPRLFASPYDLLGHAVLIGLMGALLDGALGFRPLTRWTPRWLGLGPSIIVALAGVEEILQVLSANRSSSLSDFLADVTGVVVLCTVVRILRARRSAGDPSK
ncbi:MAG: hypothetical protein JRG91_03170 [Deltaproteobacteria bacterium]|nr:hypothetical protein [Deltaproteobacteria bacterium]